MSKNIIGFFHIGVIGRWFEIYQSQIERLKKSGLYDVTEKIYIGISGENICLDLEKKQEVVCVEPKIHYGENSTIKHLYNFCKNNDCKIWYIHTKGAHYTKKNKQWMIPNVDSWRNYLEHFIIDKHNVCADKLDQYDVCGTEYCDKKYFSGNFWWANSNYVKRINIISNWTSAYTLGTWKSSRHLAERNFIGTANPNVFNFMNIYNEPRDAYFKQVQEKEYIKDLNVA